MRYLNPEEVELLIPGAEEFAKMSGLPNFNKNSFIPVIKNVIGTGSGCVIVEEENGLVIGAIGGMVILDIFTGELMSSEMFWFVSQGSGSGRKLMSEFERWSIKKGCSKIQMGLLHNLYVGSLTKMYIRKGYLPIETMFIKEV